MDKTNKNLAEIQEEENISSSNDLIYALKTSTKQSNRIHKATSKLSAQNVGEICTGAGFALNAPQEQHITAYLYLVQKWNQSMNLVGKKMWQDVLSELIIDSLHVAKFLEENPRNLDNTFPAFNATQSRKRYVFKGAAAFPHDDSLQIWDLGAGAGLPGIPLRILWQQGTYHMVEIREKRCVFLSTALASLGLPHTHVFRGKAEDFMSSNLEKGIYADLIVSRAFMPFDKMLPFVAPYLRKKNNEQKSKKGSIIFLTLENLDAKKYNSAEYQWETKQVYPYKIQGRTKFLCEVCLSD